jgi:putative tricarboxylic transport membrane protein
MFDPTRRNFTSWLAATAAGALPASAWAQAARPVPAAAASATAIPRLRIVIPANEGGGWDQTGRGLGAALVAAGAVGQIEYENIGGKGGTIGLARYVEKYDADPDTLLMSGMVMVGAVALQKPPVDMSRIAPVARLTSDYEMVVVKSDSPIMTAKDLISKLRADPANAAIAGGSAGGVDHMFAGMLARVAGNTASLVYQPFPGGAQVVSAVESGKAVAGISGYSEFSEHIASGKLRAIGVSSKSPFQGIPSVRQQGVDADLANWRGVFTGKAVPPQRQAVLLEAVRRAVATDSWLKTIKRSNWDSYWMEGKDFKSFLELDVATAGVLTYILKLKA